MVDFVDVYALIIKMSSQEIKVDDEQCVSLAKKPSTSQTQSILPSLSYQSFLLHFKKYRYVYLLLFSVMLLFLLITYAKMIFAIRSSIAQLIMLQRSTYSRDIANIQIEPQAIVPTKEVVTQDQVLLAQKWKGIRNEDLDIFSDLANEELEYYQDKYSIIDFEEQPFCLVVHNLDNRAAEGRLENIKSLLMQNYNNFHIIYVDRASTLPDNPNFEQIEQLLVQYNQKKVYKLSEKKVKRPLEMQYHIVVHTDEAVNDVQSLFLIAESNCKPDELVMFVDSSDYFIGKEVLKLFNAVYEDKRYDFTYTNFLDANNQIGNLAYMPKKKFNRTTFANTNIEAPLFAIPAKTLTLVIEDFIDDRMAYEISEKLPVNLMLPILEYLKGSSLYIPEVNFAVNFVKEGKGSHPS